MKTLSLVQGSAEWLAHRATHFNASDAPAMMGVSPYKTRNQLLHEMATGIAQEVDADTQRRFDDGHRFEALARPLAESIIGQDLYPVTGSEGKLSASFDGISMCESVIFEHKTLSNRIRAAKSASELPKDLRIQMEHQLHVSGAEKCLFMASLWDGDVLVEEIHYWYMPDEDSRSRIIDGWVQLEKDLSEYQPTETTTAAVGRTPDSLPALRIEVTGMVTASNLAEFKETALSVFRGINTDLQTDQDFADAEKAVKFCKDAEERLDAAKQHALSQTASIDELFRTVDSIKEEARTVRLKLDKLIKSEKENRRTEIVRKANMDLLDHVQGLENRLGGAWMPRMDGMFGEAIKGLKSLDSMRDKVATALANSKIEANSIADRIEKNWKTISDMTLFPDFGAVCAKAPEDFAALLAMRAGQRKDAEDKRIEAERDRIRLEEEAKAAEKVRAEQEAAKATPVKPAEVLAQQTPALKSAPRPSDEKIIAVLCLHFGVSEQTVRGWLADMKLRAAPSLPSVEYVPSG